LHYEKSLEPRREELRAGLDRLLESRAGAQKLYQQLAGHKEQIIERIGTIVGASDMALSRRVMEQFTDMLVRFTSTPVNLIVVSQEMAKDYLRQGGKLPGFTYDKPSDMVAYNFAVDSGSPLPSQIVIPVGPTSKGMFNSPGSLFGSMSVGVIIHEAVEGAILVRLKPSSPYYRWFSDGFAEAITAIVLREYFTLEMADDHLSGREVEEYADIKQQVNLAYWIGKAYGIDLPFASEKRLEQARLDMLWPHSKHGVLSMPTALR
jgi:hypothetical protein